MQVTIHNAKTTLSKLIEKVHAGEEVVIAKGTTPVARLIPVLKQEPRRRPGTLKGKIKIPASFFDPLPEDELNAWEDGGL